MGRAERPASKEQRNIARIPQWIYLLNDKRWFITVKSASPSGDFLVPDSELLGGATLRALLIEDWAALDPESPLRGY
jgi:hypothetical protein